MDLLEARDENLVLLAEFIRWVHWVVLRKGFSCM